MIYKSHENCDDWNTYEEHLDAMTKLTSHTNKLINAPHLTSQSLSCAYHSMLIQITYFIIIKYSVNLYFCHASIIHAEKVMSRCICQTQQYHLHWLQSMPSPIFMGFSIKSATCCHPSFLTRRNMRSERVMTT